MAEFGRLLERASAGTGGVLVFVGPSGSGKSALADSAVAQGRRLGFEVVRASAVRGRPVWVQVLRDVGASEQVVVGLLEDPGPLELDDAARLIVGAQRRLVVVDDLEDVELLSLIAARAAAGGTAVLVTSTTPLGVGTELALGAMAETEIVSLVGQVPDEVGRALWAASRGRPGVALSLAGELRSLVDGVDPLVHLALHSMSAAEFLDVDDSLVALLEAAATRAADDTTRARVLVRLAKELLGDSSAAARRRELVDEALELAHDDGIRPEVLDARLHALWDPEGAHDRLATAAEIVDLARRSGDSTREREGLFWRFVALMELGRVADAESALAAFERAATAAGDGPGRVMVLARHGMLAGLRGRFEQAEQIAASVAEAGRRIGMPDTGRLAMTVLAPIWVERLADREHLNEGLATLQAIARRLPGHFFEATAAPLLVELGRLGEAAAELDRVLPRVLAGSGPRWVSAVADLGAVAVAVGDTEAATRPSAALLPYRGRLVVLGGANTVWGTTCRPLARLAAHLGELDEAVELYAESLALEETIGALPWAAHSLAELADVLTVRGAPGDLDLAVRHRARARTIAERLGMTVLLDRMRHPAEEWVLRRDGDDWLLEAGTERARLRDRRGLHYLRALLAVPRQEISALDLVAGGGGLVAGGVGPVLDEQAVAAYRSRLSELDADLAAADRAGDADSASRAEVERDALLAELRRATGLGGRPRQASPEAERARVNVTRTLRAAIDVIAGSAPTTAAHLAASVRTGLSCRYDPAPNGPARWRV